MNVVLFIAEVRKPTIGPYHKKAKDEPRDPHDEAVAKVVRIEGGDDGGTTRGRKSYEEGSVI